MSHGRQLPFLFEKKDMSHGKSRLNVLLYPSFIGTVEKWPGVFYIIFRHIFHLSAGYLSDWPVASGLHVKMDVIGP